MPARADRVLQHVADPARFFAQCHNLLRPGGLLLICDDFRRTTGEPGASDSIERFRRGWHVNTLLESGELRSLARAGGFEHEATTDLSPHLELCRVRDRVAGVLLTLLGWRPLNEARYGYLWRSPFNGTGDGSVTSGLFRRSLVSPDVPKTPPYWQS